LITILGKSSKCTYTQKKEWSDSNIHNLLISTQHPSNRNPVPGSCCGSLTAYRACIRQNLRSYFPLCFNFLISQNSLKMLTCVMQALHFLKIVLDTLELVLKYRHFVFSHKPSFSTCKECRLCMILGFQHSANEVCSLMGCYTAMIGIWLVSW
jgi:hypothetical protein